MSPAPAPAFTCSACGAGVAGARYCPECGTPVAAAPQIVPDTDAAELFHLDSPEEQPAPRRRPWALVALSAVSVIGLLVGALGVGFAVQAKNREQDLSTRVASMAAQVNHQSAKIKAQQTQLNSTANTESIKGVNHQLTKVNSTLAQYRNCIPELQAELDGLTIDYNIDDYDSSQDYFNIDNGSQISHDCSDVLYGQSMSSGD